MKNTSSFTRSISVNGRFLSQPITGVQRYAYELLTALDVLLASGTVDAVPVTVLVPPDATIFPSWSTVRIQPVGRFTGQLWEQIDLAFHARGTLLFTPCGGAPLAHGRNVITIHDAGPFATPHAYSFAYRNYYKFLQRVLARTASHIITVSEFSKRELIRYLSIPERKISYTLLSGEHALRFPKDSSVLKKHGLKPRKYVLAVGSRNPNKNLQGLVKAAAYLKAANVPLVIAGTKNSVIFREKETFSEQVKEIGFVSDAALRSLYEHAACFVFPSFYEGFGFPPLEALTLGTPVVVSRAASLPEVFGDAVSYCDPNSPVDIAIQIADVLAGRRCSADLARRRAALFRWEQCARDTWQIILSLLV